MILYRGCLHHFVNEIHMGKQTFSNFGCIKATIRFARSLKFLLISCLASLLSFIIILLSSDSQGLFVCSSSTSIGLGGIKRVLI